MTMLQEQAKVISVMADPDEKMASVIVPDYQLSLAIGKEGQNARLAARLTNYKIDIKSETQAIESGELPADYMEQMQMMEEGYSDYGEAEYVEEDGSGAAYSEEGYTEESGEYSEDEDYEPIEFEEVEE